MNLLIVKDEMYNTPVEKCCPVSYYTYIGDFVPKRFTIVMYLVDVVLMGPLNNVTYRDPVDLVLENPTLHHMSLDTKWFEGSSEIT